MTQDELNNLKAIATEVLHDKTYAGMASNMADYVLQLCDEVERLQPLAHTGELVEAMDEGWVLVHAHGEYRCLCDGSLDGGMGIAPTAATALEAAGVGK